MLPNHVVVMQNQGKCELLWMIKQKTVYSKICIVLVYLEYNVCNAQLAIVSHVDHFVNPE